MSALFDEDTQHVDPLTDALLVGGKVYIGDPGVDPVVNPKNVYDNRLFTGAPLAQPLIIGIDGRVADKAWVSGKYSYRIDSSADVLKYQELDNGSDEAVGNIQTTGSLGVNAITATGVPVQTAYVDNKTYIVTAPADNTGAMTINIDGLGVVDIKKAHDQAIVSGDVKADMKLVLVYNATDGWMELQSAVLGSVFSGAVQVGGSIQVGEDLDLTGAAPQIITSTTNADLDIAPNGTGQLTYNSNEVVTNRATVADHVRAGNTQLLASESAIADFEAETNITVNTWESVGPTGSGADNIWAAMDSLPSDASILLVEVRIAIVLSGTGQGFLYAAVVSGDKTPGVPGQTGRFAGLVLDANSAGSVAEVWKAAMIPLDPATQTFKLQWSTSGTSTTTLDIHYKGFMTD